MNQKIEEQLKLCALQIKTFVSSVIRLQKKHLNCHPSLINGVCSFPTDGCINRAFESDQNGNAVPGMTNYYMNGALENHEDWNEPVVEPAAINIRQEPGRKSIRSTESGRSASPEQDEGELDNRMYLEYYFAYTESEHEYFQFLSSGFL